MEVFPTVEVVEALVVPFRDEDDELTVLPDLPGELVVRTGVVVAMLDGLIEFVAAELLPKVDLPPVVGIVEPLVGDFEDEDDLVY